MAQLNVNQLISDMNFEGFLLVRSAEVRQGKAGSYVDMNLADRTGEVNCKIWDANAKAPAQGTVVKVRGRTTEYNGRLQMKIERIRPMTEEDQVDMKLLTPCAPETPENMLQQINDTVAAMSSEVLKKLTAEMLTRFHEKLMYYPAAQRIHHAELGGLLHHTTGMLNTAKALMKVYPFLNSDLLYAGVILHDICKTEEMDSDRLGIVRDYSTEGLLLGHLVMGVYRIQEVANDLHLQGEEILLLQHMLLSHHGQPDFGSPRMPMFAEAEVLHWIDLLDARMNEMQAAVSKVAPGAFTDKIWSLDRRLYRPLFTAEPQTQDEPAANAAGTDLYL